MYRIATSIIALIILAAMPVLAETSTGTPTDIIPVPQHIETADGVYSWPEPTATFHIDGGNGTLAEYLKADSLSEATDENRADILINITEGDGSEAYTLTITPGKIIITSPGEAGAFYAIQSLRQMTRCGNVRQLQCCTIADAPRFTYRGLHFDVSRHFRSKEFLMKQIDAMALLKLNSMHLHLTDAAGWRLQIDRYPRLTELAAWRPYKRWEDWWNGDRSYCTQDAPGAYGGYYTKDDIRQIVEYARTRNITVIPEIEMPGHSEEVLAAYPGLSCSGKPYVDADFCIGNDSTFTFLENVLTEVIDLFPSQYIHIGGDEATKKGWAQCPKCKLRMEQEGLADVDELQSYMIHRIEQFVQSKGRTVVGFDEIMQGGLAPGAVVMSWRGSEPGIEAMEQGNQAIMNPNAYYYLDYTQDAPFKEPVSIGGYLPLEKVYSFEPLPDSITGTTAQNLLGVQANVWAEYITDDSHAEYMYYPRAFALAETGWSQPSKKDYADFRRRALALIEQLRLMGYNTFDLAQEYGDRKESNQPLRHLARGAKVIYNIPYSRQYPAAGDSALTDGVCGGWTYGDNRWQGTMRDLDVTIDLGSAKPVRYVGATFLQSVGAWVYMPRRVDIYLSDDGEHFTLAGQAWCDVPDTSAEIRYKVYSTLCDTTARYVRLHAVKHPRRGAWLFTDEIVIN